MVVTDLAIGAVSEEHVADYDALHIVRGQIILNRIGTPRDAELFRIGIDEFDLLWDSQIGRTARASHHIERYIQERALVRSMKHKGTTGPRPVASSVLQPLPGHSLYNPDADARFLFEAHEFLPNYQEDIDPQAPHPESVRGFVALGHAALTRLS